MVEIAVSDCVVRPSRACVVVSLPGLIVPMQNHEVAGEEKERM